MVVGDIVLACLIIQVHYIYYVKSYILLFKDGYGYLQAELVASVIFALSHGTYKLFYLLFVYDEQSWKYGGILELVV